MIAPSGGDDFGPVFRFSEAGIEFRFAFRDGAAEAGSSEPAHLTRQMRPITAADGVAAVLEVWCTGASAFVYPVLPRAPQPVSAPELLRTLPYKPGMYIPGTGGFSGLGAHLLGDGRVLFGLYHPNAARVFLAGSFNDWQRPGHETPDPARFIELGRYRGWFGEPNTWLVVTDRARPGDEYRFLVQGGVPADDKGRLQRLVTDLYARRLGGGAGHDNAVVVDPTAFGWRDAGWRTPDMGGLVLYELSVYGFTEGDPDVPVEHHGKFRGITERIRDGYFERLGGNALSLMPLAEVPSPQGATSLGYDPSLYFTVERDFGTPGDLRELIDTAHEHGLAVLLDQVFNHTSNDFNPLWKIVLEHPGEEANPAEGDFTKEKLGRAHHMKLGSKSLRATAARQ